MWKWFIQPRNQPSNQPYADSYTPTHSQTVFSWGLAKIKCYCQYKEIMLQKYTA